MPRRVMEGRVVSDKGNKTITVLVERRIMDPMYKKFIRRSKKYAAHDEANVFRTGDFVSIEECAPISKSKRWKVTSPAPAEKREDKAVVIALAARTEALLNKPESKKAKKAAAAKAAPKAAAPKAEKPAKKTATVEAAAETPVKPTKAAKPSAKAEPAAKAKPAAKKKKDDK